MENAAIFEAESNAAALAIEDAPPRSTVLEDYLRGRATRVQPHVVEHAAPTDLAVIPTPWRIRCREVLFRVGAIIVFAAAVAGIIHFWPPFGY